MKKILILIICLPLTLTAYCGQNGAKRNAKTSVKSSLPASIRSKYRLVWNDEFEGKSLDLSKWNYRAEGTVRKYGVVSRNAISLDGKGNILLKVTKDDAGKYFIGQLGTQGIFETTYGYFECRCEMNKELGPHVAFWLQSADFGKTGDFEKDGTEIDIFEYHRKTPGIVNHNLHWGGYGANHKKSGVQIPFASVDSGFHTFGLEWTADAYVFYVDGIETWRSASAVSHCKEYIILSAELTGWGGDPALGNFPDAVTFDYVRVYKPKKQK